LDAYITPRSILIKDLVDVKVTIHCDEHESQWFDQITKEYICLGVQIIGNASEL